MKGSAGEEGFCSTFVGHKAYVVTTSVVGAVGVNVRTMDKISVEVKERWTVDALHSTAAATSAWRVRLKHCQTSDSRNSR